MKPRGDGESHGKTTKMNDQKGLAAEHKEGKQKQHLYSERNEETKTDRGKDAVGGSTQMDGNSEHSPDSTHEAIAIAMNRIGGKSNSGEGGEVI